MITVDRARVAGKAFADAIYLVTDLFYQVDNRHRFMEAFMQRLEEIKVEMDADRKRRRGGSKTGMLNKDEEKANGETA